MSSGDSIGPDIDMIQMWFDAVGKEANKAELINSDALPIDGFYDLDLATNDTFTINTDGLVVDGNITTKTLSAVPIPATAWLFGTGIIGLIGFSRRRKFQ